MSEGRTYDQGAFEGQVLFRLKALDDQLRDIYARLGQMESRGERDSDRLDTRIRVLEHASTRIQAIAAVLAAGAGYLASLVPKPWT